MGFELACTFILRMCGATCFSTERMSSHGTCAFTCTHCVFLGLQYRVVLEFSCHTARTYRVSTSIVRSLRLDPGSAQGPVDPCPQSVAPWVGIMTLVRSG